MEGEKKERIRVTVAHCPVCGQMRSADEKQYFEICSWAETHAALHRAKREK